MTNNEVKATLECVDSLMGVMEKSKVRTLLKILIGAQVQKPCASFFYIDIRKLAKKLLHDTMKAERVNRRITRKQMKQIYEILADYHMYPRCKLCNQPIIYLDSKAVQHDPKMNQMAFSWDHIKPKSEGGSYKLSNMQPTHKICNNKRGTDPIKPEKTKKKKTKEEGLNLHIQIVLDGEECGKPATKVYRSKHFGLRKQDSWCHKQCCCRYGR